MKSANKQATHKITNEAKFFLPQRSRRRREGILDEECMINNEIYHTF